MRQAAASIRAAAQRRWDYDGRPRNLAMAAAWTVGLTGFGIIAERIGIVDQWYGGAPFVALVAVIASRLGLRSALLAAALSALALNYFFLPVGQPDGFSWPDRVHWTLYGSMLIVACLVARTRAPNDPTTFDRGQNLPFTGHTDTNNTDRPGGLHSNGWVFWDVRPTGDWSADTHLGAEYCRIWASRAQHGERRPLLSWVLHDMIKAGKWSGIEAGWASALEQRAFRRQPSDLEGQSQQSSG
jgi:hypothetical protein